MCYFILVGVKENDLDKAQLLLASDGVFPVSEACEELQSIQPEYRFLSIISGGCACDLYQAYEVNVSSLRRKYKKKKWSESKIDKAVEEAISSKKKKSGISSAVSEGVIKLADLGVQPIVFVYWSEVSLSKESGVETISTTTFSNSPELIEENTIYRVSA